MEGIQKKNKEMRNIVERMAVTVVLVLWWVIMPKVGYGGANDTPCPELLRHALYMVSHANVWHLLGNLFVLWIMRGKMYLVPSLVVAVVMSFVPACGTLWDAIGCGSAAAQPTEGVVTMGFSGVLFAIIGVKWGIWCRSFVVAGWPFERDAYLEFCAKVLPFALIGAVIPHVNWCLHLYCLMGGFLYGRVIRRW